jgi:hypothetical protein
MYGNITEIQTQYSRCYEKEQNRNVSTFSNDWPADLVAVQERRVGSISGSMLRGYSICRIKQKGLKFQADYANINTSFSL